MRDFFRMVFASMLGTSLIFFVAFLFFVGSVIGAVGFSATQWQSEKKKSGQKDILRIKLAGPIVERYQPPSLWQGLTSPRDPVGIGLYELTQTLKAASKDKSIKGLFLDVQGLAAGWGHLESLRRELKKFKEGGKFIISYAEYYSEKTYYLASVADKVVLYPRGFFEWDGMYLSNTYFKKAMDKWGVTPKIFRVGKYKSAIEPFITDKMSDASREQLNALVGGIWGEVTETVATDRKISPEKLEEWAGEVSTIFAIEAKENGLVDALEPLEEVELDLIERTKADEKPGWFSWSLYYQENVLPALEKGGDKIAVIIADGSIVDGRGDAGQVGSHTYRKIMSKIRDDEDVKGVVLRVNSPGGSALASDVMWMSSTYLKEKKESIIASFGNVAASGGYYMSAGASKIMAEKMSITGSIGVFGLNFNTRKFWNENVGVTFDREKTHAMADRQTTVRDLSPREAKKIQSVVDRIYQDFLTVVTQGRAPLNTIEASHQVAQGRVWLGKDAKEMGLVDEFGGLEEAIAQAAEVAKLDNYSVEIYPKERNPFEEVMRQFGQASRDILVSILPNQILSMAKSLKPTQRLEEMVWARMPFDIEIQ